MNYYIITKEVFESLVPSSIQFAHRSQDSSKWIVTTLDTIGDTLLTFNNVADLSTYTINNNAEWTGDGQGLEEWYIEETECLSGL